MPSEDPSSLLDYMQKTCIAVQAARAAQILVLPFPLKEGQQAGFLHISV